MFTDVVVPDEMTGYELARLARQDRSDLNLQFTSGYTAMGPGQQTSPRNAEPLLSKPYRKHELAHFVRAALHEKR